ncbi:MAG TPA: hypothetical protein VGM30_10625 [Puia sp.]|jgi:hypothetical protein
MQILNALQTKAGAKTEYSKIGSLTQPLQFLPLKEKDAKWAAWNLDWLEYQGVKQIRRNGKRFLKNIRLAYGIIERSDYLVEEANESGELIDYLTKEDSSALDLKFYPIIPNVINVLTGEFSKRTSKIMFRAVDDTSYNEMLEEKRQMLEDTLVRQAEQKVFQQMIQQGEDPNSPEAKQALSPDNIKSLPEIEAFFGKSYRSMIEEWATHQKQVDEERFKMQEAEERQFARMLILNREFWHFKMNEDDYEIEEWDPVFTFYHKSPDTRYISQGNFAGKIDLMTVADVIDKYGYLMSDEQLRTLEFIYPVKSLAYNLSGTPNDGSFYDGSRSYKWNTNSPSLGYRQMAGFFDNFKYNGDIVQWLMNDTEDFLDFGNTNLIRVSTIYWKTQRKLFHLTKIDKDNPEPIQEIVDETYKVTCKPIYDTTIYTLKTKDNLVYGEHLDAIWINEVWGGVRIGANRPTSWMNEPSEVNPIYLGINRPEPGRLPFQFKGDLSLYGCKLPIEGSVFSDRNMRSVSLVDLMKPFQIGYNLTNNQISDILVDELGTVILLDQNALPKQSLGEDWGRGNLAKAFVAMRNFQILPLDTTLQNTEGATQFNQYTQLNMEQTNRLMSRIQLSKYFKEAAFEVVGVTPQRIGEVAASETATGTTQAVNNSYSQTEKYFTQHSDWLMPRVHQMRTDLAQYYQSKNPSLRLQYITSMDERVNFQMNGTDLLSRDINVFCTTKVNHREILQQMKQIALTNNTAGASIYDLGNVIKAESIAELTRVLKSAEDKTAAQKQQEQDQQQQLQQQQEEAQAAALKDQQAFDAQQRDLDRQKDITVAEIKAAGYPDTSDNGEDEYMNRLQFIQGQSQYEDTMNFKRQQEDNKIQMNNQKVSLDQQKMQTQRDVAQKQENIARINKNKYDRPAQKKK